MSNTIWIINQFAGKSDSGWGERHHFLSKYWVKKGYEVKIISGSYNHLFIDQPITKGKNFTIEEVEKGITFCWVKIPKYNPNSIFKFLYMLLFTSKLFFLNKKKLGCPSVIIISSMPIFSVFPAYVKAKINKAKLIFEIRDLWPETPIHLKGYSTRNPFIATLKLIEKFAYRKSENIVSLLPNAYNYVNRISKKPNKFKYIPNGIDENLIKNENLSDLTISLIPKDKFIVGYAGTIGLANTMEFFIDCAILMKNNKNIHFVLVGDGYLKEEFQIQTKDSNNITFIPKIKKSQVQNMLKYFDVCYVGRYNSPLYDHGVSYNKYFDYMLAKKIILESSNFIKDPVELSGCGIIVEPENAQAINDGIIKIYNMPENERKEIGLKGYTYVKKYHNFDYLSDQYVELF